MRQGSGVVKIVTAAGMLAAAVTFSGCATDQSVRTYVSGWDGANAATRAKLTELQGEGRVTLVQDLYDEEQSIDYVVLASLPNGVVEQHDEDAPPSEVLDRLHFFGMLDAHEHAETAAAERGIPIVEMPRFLEMLETGEAERRSR